MNLKNILKEEFNDLVDNNFKLKDTVGYIIVENDNREYWDASSKKIQDWKQLYSSDLEDSIKLAKNVVPFETFEDATRVLNILNNLKAKNYLYEDFSFSIHAVIFRTFEAAFTKKMEV